MKIYKIRNKVTGEYSKGGGHPYFNKRGKIWKGIGPLKNHINLVKEYRLLSLYKDCEIVIFEVTETEVKTISDINSI
jgi:hypothetical protein